MIWFFLKSLFDLSWTGSTRQLHLQYFVCSTNDWFLYVKLAKYVLYSGTSNLEQDIGFTQMMFVSYLSQFGHCYQTSGSFYSLCSKMSHVWGDVS